MIITETCLLTLKTKKNIRAAETVLTENHFCHFVLFAQEPQKRSQHGLKTIDRLQLTSIDQEQIDTNGIFFQ